MRIINFKKKILVIAFLSISLAFGSSTFAVYMDNQMTLVTLVMLKSFSLFHSYNKFLLKTVDSIRTVQRKLHHLYMFLVGVHTPSQGI